MTTAFCRVPRELVQVEMSRAIVPWLGGVGELKCGRGGEVVEPKGYDDERKTNQTHPVAQPHRSISRKPYLF